MRGSISTNSPLPAASRLAKLAGQEATIFLGEKSMRPQFRGLSRLAAISIVAIGLTSLAPSRAVAAENWDLYVYNPVATVAAVKGMNTIIEQIEKETNGELKVRLHLGGS